MKHSYKSCSVKKSAGLRIVCAYMNRNLQLSGPEVEYVFYVTAILDYFSSHMICLTNENTVLLWHRMHIRDLVQLHGRFMEIGAHQYFGQADFFMPELCSEEGGARKAFWLELHFIFIKSCGDQINNCRYSLPDSFAPDPVLGIGFQKNRILQFYTFWHKEFLMILFDVLLSKDPVFFLEPDPDLGGQRTWICNIALYTSTSAICKWIWSTCSQFLINCITVWIKNWKVNNWMTKDRKPVKNREDLEVR